MTVYFLQLSQLVRIFIVREKVCAELENLH